MARVVFHVRSLGLCATLLAALPARADETLPPVVVPAPTPAPEAPTRRDPSGAVTVIDAREREGEAKALAELLAQTPGLVVQDAGGLGQMKTVSIRGAAGNGVLVTLDGVPLQGAGGNVDLSLVPAALIERIEVLRGGGARYGSGALGGVVNVVTRAPARGARLFGEVTHGSFTTTLAQAGASGPVAGGQGLVLLHGSRTEGDFPYLRDDLPGLPLGATASVRRENNQALLGGALLKLRRPVGAARVEASAELAAERRGLAGLFNSPTPQASSRSVRGSATARASWSLGAGELSARAWGKRESLQLTGPDFRQTLQSEGAEVEGGLLLAERHGLSFLAAVAGEALQEPSDADPAWVRLSAMVADDILLFGGDLVVAPSLRVDRTGPFTTLSPKLGASARLPAGLSLKANAGQAHRAPSFLELYVEQGFLMPNGALRPERALTADAAVSHATSWSQVSAGVFESLFEDLITYESFPPRFSQPTNFLAARVRGLELEGLARPRPWLSLLGSYTLLHTANLKDDPRFLGKPLPYRPRHKAYGRLAAGPRWLSGRVEVLHQSEQATNRTGSPLLRARTFLNAGLSSELFRAPQLTLSVELKNLLDVQSQDLTGYPLPGRAAFFTVAVALDAERPSPEAPFLESVATR